MCAYPCALPPGSYGITQSVLLNLLSQGSLNDHETQGTKCQKLCVITLSHLLYTTLTLYIQLTCPMMLTGRRKLLNQVTVLGQGNFIHRERN